MIWILVSLKSVNYFSSIENFPKRDIPAAKIPINAHGKQTFINPSRITSLKYLT
jgi:hypothetical protein